MGTTNSECKLTVNLTEIEACAAYLAITERS